MSDIESIVNPVFAAAGVPTKIWETVSEVESADDPNRIGDNGTSFGLFQLHRGGQLPAEYSSNPSAVFDPLLNAKIAAPSIINAFKTTPGNPTTLAYWQQFAITSGHPGGSATDPATQAEALLLYKQYNGGGVPVTNSTLVSNSDGLCSWYNPATYAQCVQNAIDSTIQSEVNSIIDPLRAGAIKAGVFLIAVALLIAGFYVVGNQEVQK